MSTKPTREKASVRPEQSTDQYAQERQEARERIAKSRAIHTENKLREALRDIRDCAYDPWKIGELNTLAKFASRVYAVSKAALEL